MPEHILQAQRQRVIAGVVHLDHAGFAAVLHLVGKNHRLIFAVDQQLIELIIGVENLDWIIEVVFVKQVQFAAVGIDFRMDVFAPFDVVN